nr:hypothetical protein [uncultured Marinifilum sp.]
MNKLYARGSEWRKWDLHIHTPNTAKNDQFGTNSWNAYISKLEENDDIAVLGITDYFCIENYNKLKKEQNEGRLRNKYLIPNVELRILPVTQRDTPINIHVLFNPEKVNILEREFFRKLKFSYRGADYSCIKSDLIELGRAYKNDPNLDEESAKKEGIGQFNVPFEKIREILEGNILDGEYIIGVSNSNKDGNSGIQHSSLAATREEIYRMSDFIFSGNPRDTTYFLGKGADSKRELLQKYGSIMPCITGSDAHSMNSINVFPKDRITWLKADPTFEGLKHTLIEPNERVFIGEEPEIFKRVIRNRTKYIKEINVNPVTGYNGHKGKWFEDVNIELNKELTAIIGNKGSGKSALSDITALCGNFYNPKSFSFLSKDKFRKGGLADCFEGQLTWESDVESKYNLNENPIEGATKNVKYLPQGDFETLTNEIEKAEAFQKEIEDVVFSHVKEEAKLGHNTFSDLIESQKSNADASIEFVASDLKDLNKSIIQLEKMLNPNYKAQIEGKIKQKTDELNALIKPLVVANPNTDTSIAQKSKELNDLLNSIRKNIEEKEKSLGITKEKLEKVSIEKNGIEKLKQSIELKEEEIKSFKTDFKNQLLKFDIDIEKVIHFQVDYSTLISAIKLKSEESEKLNKEINGSSEEKGLVKEIEEEKNKLAEESKKLDGPQKKYQKYLNDLKEWEKKKKIIEGNKETPDTLEYHKMVIDYLDNKLEGVIHKKREERLNCVDEIFEKKKSIISIYEQVKKGIDNKIEENKDLLTNYNINIEASLVLQNNFVSDFLKYISKNKLGSFFSKEGGTFRIQQIIDGKDFNNVEDVKSVLSLITEALFTDLRDDISGDKSRYIENQVDNINDFYNYLFGLEYIDYNYQLKLGEKVIEQLSPGERGALLLVFYLLLDKNDCPLILDQPEDNLDNHSVANVLVPFIKKAKQKRQIILVTHNPNLAVVADAEQIIWVNIDKEDKNKFEYTAGSIESKEINKHIVDVLEGAMPAFNKRKQKYYEN